MKDRIRYYLTLLALAVALIAGNTGCSQASGGAVADSESGGQAKSSAAGEIEPLTVTFIDVGQGDSALLQCGGHNMLIDAGKNDRGIELQDYLQSKGIKKFDYLIGTHPDEDHIGGLDVIITKFQAEHVLMPDKKSDTKTYDDVIQAIRYKSISLEHPERGDTFSLGDAEITVLAPSGETYDNTNNYSIVLMVRHGDNRFLFTGDAEEEAEYDMLQAGMDLKADVLKTGHHGSRSSSGQEFLDSVSPAAAVISCGENNSYGHPHAETLNKFRSMGIKVYRTDEEGAVVAESDGNNISFNVPPSDSWVAGEPKGSSAENKRDSGTKGEKKETYVLNTKTKKFHYSWCDSTIQMKEENKDTKTANRSSLISEGYDPCQKCRP